MPIVLFTWSTPVTSSIKVRSPPIRQVVISLNRYGGEGFVKVMLLTSSYSTIAGDLSKGI
jgi:hypothetical protein